MFSHFVGLSQVVVCCCIDLQVVARLCVEVMCCVGVKFVVV